MTYQEFTNQFILTCTTTLNAFRDALIADGVAANKITVGEVVDGNIDLRYAITAIRGNKTFTAYIELTPVRPPINEMTLMITLGATGNGTTITTSYVVGTSLSYISGLNELLTRLTSATNVLNGELLTKAKTFLV